MAAKLKQMQTQCTVQLSQFGEAITPQYRTLTAQTGECEVFAVSCSSMTGSVWSGELVILERTAKEEGGKLRIKQVLETYAGNSCVAWAGSAEPQNPLLLSGGDDGAVYVWNLANLANTNDDSKHGIADTSEAVAVAASENENTSSGSEPTATPPAAAAAAAESPAVPPVPVASLFDHSDMVSSVATKPDASSGGWSQLVLTGSWDTSVKLWDLQSSAFPVSSFTGHRRQVNCVEWGGSVETSNTFLSASADSTLCFWDCRISALTHRIRTTDVVASLAWDPHQTTNFAAGSEDGSVSVYDSRNLKQIVAINRDLGLPIRCLDYSPTVAGCLVVGCDEPGEGQGGTLTSRGVAVLQQQGGGFQLRSNLRAHSDFVRGVCWSAVEPGVLLSSSWDHTVVQSQMM